MLMQTALDIISEKSYPSPKGYYVSFERVEGKFLITDYFPDRYRGESLIPTEEEAWKLAKSFAMATTGCCVNINVVRADFTPVSGYKDKLIINRKE